MTISVSDMYDRYHMVKKKVKHYATYYYNTVKNLVYNPIKTEIEGEVFEDRSAWRVRREFSDRDRKMASAKNAILSWLTYDLIDESFQEKLEWRKFKDLEDEEGEVVEWQQDWEQANFKPDWIRACQLAIRDGVSAVRVPSMKLHPVPESDVLFEDFKIKVFEKDNIELSYENNWGILTGYKLREWLGRYSQPGYVEHHIPPRYEDEELIGSGELSDVVMLIPKPHSKFKHEGEYYYESILDSLDVMEVALESMGLYLRRMGAGMRRAKMVYTGDKSFDEKRETDFDDGLKKWESADMTMILGKFLLAKGDGTKILAEDDAELMTGDSQVKYMEIIETCLWFIAGKTGVPKNRFVGLFSGELTGADVSMDQMFRVYEKMQTLFEPFLIQFAKRWCEIVGHAWDENIKPVFALKPKLREEQKANIDLVKAQRWGLLKSSQIVPLEMIYDVEGWDKKYISMIRKEADMLVEFQGASRSPGAPIPPALLEPEDPEP